VLRIFYHSKYHTTPKGHVFVIARRIPPAATL
jgi:hypothetical protein